MGKYTINLRYAVICRYVCSAKQIPRFDWMGAVNHLACRPISPAPDIASSGIAIVDVYAGAAPLSIAATDKKARAPQAYADHAHRLRKARNY